MAKDSFISWRFYIRHYWPPWENNTDQWGLSVAALESASRKLNGRTITDDMTSGKWAYAGPRSGCLAPNGYVYCPPWSNTQVLKYNHTLTGSKFGSFIGTEQWRGCTLAPDGCIYCAPFNHASILKIDPTTDTTSLIGDFGTGTKKWYGAVCRLNGDIVFAPHSSNSFLVVDTAGNTYTYGNLSGNYKYGSCVLAPNGTVYAIPFGAGNIAKLAPDNTVSTVGSFTETNAYGKWTGGILAPSGKIYGLPYTRTDILVIDPADDSYFTFGATENAPGYRGSCLGPDGKIYSLSKGVRKRIVVDPELNTITLLTSPPGVSVAYGHDTILHPSGKLIVVGDPPKTWGLRTDFNLEIDYCCSRYFNNH